jgi:hypothetical protein
LSRFPIEQATNYDYHLEVDPLERQPLHSQGNLPTNGRDSIRWDYFALVKFLGSLIEKGTLGRTIVEVNFASGADRSCAAPIAKT